MNDNNTTEDGEMPISIDDIDELDSELEIEEGITEKKPICHLFWPNFLKSWNRKKNPEGLKFRFQKLAGIISDKAVAAVFVNGQRIEFTELPSWKQVIRFKIAGFKYETYK